MRIEGDPIAVSRVGPRPVARHACADKLKLCRLRIIRFFLLHRIAIRSASGALTKDAPTPKATSYPVLYPIRECSLILRWSSAAPARTKRFTMAAAAAGVAGRQWAGKRPSVDAVFAHSEPDVLQSTTSRNPLAILNFSLRLFPASPPLTDVRNRSTI
jgi:hypothetical protein